MGLFISAARILIYMRLVLRGGIYNGGSRQDTESFLPRLSLKARFILEAWMASSMLSMRNREMKYGDSRLRRESDPPRLFKVRPFISEVTTESSMRWIPRPEDRNGGFRQPAQLTHRRLSRMGLRTSAVPMAIFTLSMQRRERGSGGSKRHLVG